MTPPTESSFDTSPDDDLDRLADAVEAYIDRAENPAERESVDDYLEQNERIRDLLEPMLDDRPGTAGEGDAADERRLGDYRLGRELGRGGMGIVYEAVEQSLGRRIALKVLSPSLTLSRRQVERFRREAAAAAKLVHRDIVRIHAVGEHDGTHFIAMELVEGKSLRVVMDEVKARVRGDASRLGSRDVLVTTRFHESGAAAKTATAASGTAGQNYFDQIAELTARIAEALAYSHDRGVVHRDIKPQNVLISETGQVCVVDFGLAKDLEAASLSHTGEFAGTPQYVSPEQVEAGRAPIDGRSDVFSLGVVLYELLTLSAPFSGSTTRQVMNAIATHEPPALRSRSPNVPRDLETIALKSLEKDPRRRYSAQELAEDLRRYLAREPIAARPISPLFKALRFARRKPAATLAGVFAFLLLVVTPLAAMVHFKNARDELAAEKQRTQEQHELAQRFLTQARSAVRRLYTRVAEYELEALPHTEPLRIQLLEDATELSDQFVEIAADDPMLLYEAARARGSLAKMQQSLAQPEGALASLSEAIELMRTGFPDNRLPIIATIDLAVMHESRAQALLDLRRFDEAMPDIERAESLLGALQRTKLSAQRWRDARSARAMLLDARRRHAMRIQPTAEAQEYTERATAIWRELALEDPEDVESTRLYVLSRTNLASILLGRGRLIAARDHFLGAKELLDQLLTERPGFPPYLFRLARVHLGLADVSRRLGVQDQSRDHREAGLRILRDLCDKFPNTPFYRRDLLHLELVQAMQQSAKNKTVPAAAKAIARLLPIAEDLASRPGAQPDDMFNLATAHKVRAQVEYMKVARDVDVLEHHFAAGMKVLRQLIEQWPDVPRYRTALGGLLSNRANWLLRFSGRPPAEAFEMLDEAIELQTTALNQSPNNETARSYLAVHYNLLAQTAARMKSPELLERAAIGTVELAPMDRSRLLQGVRFLITAIGLLDEAEAEQRGATMRDLACGWIDAALPHDRDEALHLLERPDLAALRDHPKFRELRARFER